MTGTDRVALIVLCAAQFMLIVDVVVVNVALPTLRSTLDIPESQLSLAAVAYTVTFGSLLIAAGRSGDLRGRRTLFLAGLVTFTIASLLTGLAQEPWQFFAARAAQGVGAAMVSPNALALLLSRFDDAVARNKAMGVWGAVGAGGAIAGQVLGGVVVDSVGWRWIFLINVPVGIVAVVFGARFLHRSRGEAAATTDHLGSALLVLGLLSAVLALAWAPIHGLNTTVVTACVTAMVLLLFFVAHQRRAAAPLVPLRLLRTPGVLSANAVIAISAATVTASLFFTTLYLQVVLGHSALMVGIAFAPIAVLIMGLSPVVARLVSRYGARGPMIAGLLLGACGMMWLSRMSSGGSYWVDVLPALLCIACGSALTYVSTYIAATARVAPTDQGAASGMLNTAQELGPAIGLAAIAAVATGLIGNSTDPAGLVVGYQAGSILAAILTLAGVVAAARIPGNVGRASAPAEESHTVDTREPNIA
jgi:EmrB/QacA subfamily drug resistance transporter